MPVVGLAVAGGGLGVFRLGLAGGVGGFFAVDFVAHQCGDDAYELVFGEFAVIDVFEECEGCCCAVVG